MKGVYIIMSNIADKFEELGVIPVVVLNDAKDALPLACLLYTSLLRQQMKRLRQQESTLNTRLVL